MAAAAIRSGVAKRGQHKRGPSTGSLPVRFFRLLRATANTSAPLASKCVAQPAARMALVASARQCRTPRAEAARRPRFADHRRWHSQLEAVVGRGLARAQAVRHLTMAWPAGSRCGGSSLARAAATDAPPPTRNRPQPRFTAACALSIPTPPHLHRTHRLLGPQPGCCLVWRV